MELQPGSTLGPYVLGARLGAGGMGEVYAATDPRLGREVAIKVHPEEGAASPRALVRFEREARAVAALSHPNVLVVHDVGAACGLRYVVTELLQGESLHARLDRGPLGWRQAVALAADVADGLQAAHDRGIVHRDLKPANLFLTRDGRVKILDFGVARFLRGDDPGSSGERTLPGSVLGSLGYMSPEQAAGGELDGRSDLFSLGCVLYEMLTGERAFAGGSLPQTMAALARDEPRPVRELAPAVPPELAAVVVRCLRKRPNERYASAGEVAAALRSLLTASGEQRRDETAVRPGGGAMGRWLRALGAVLPRRAAGRSLAVLPFVSEGHESDSEYLADGLSESIIRSLSALPELHVMAWSTVAPWRGRAVEPRQAAAALGVDVVLVGRVAERGAQLVVNAELVEGASGKCLWSERYARPVTDLLEVQDAIARQLARRLQSRLAGDDGGPARRTTNDPEAYRLYLKGRYHWNRRSEDGLVKSRQHFREAIGRDPGYALAYAGLADAFNVLPFWGLMPPVDAFVQGKAAARAALDLDPGLAEAHASLGYALFWYDWEWPAAQAEFRAAIDLEPGYATAHHWYGVALAATGAWAAAEESLRLAEEIEPLSLIVRADQGLVRYWQGDFAGACSRCRAVLDLDPEFVPAHLYLGLALEQLGETDEALSALRRAAEGGATSALAALAHAFAAAGEVELAREGVAQLAELAGSRYVSPYLVAVLHTGLGDFAAACDWLARGVETRCEMMPWVPRDPRLRPLAGYPRFAALAERVALGRRDAALPRTLPGASSPETTTRPG